MTSYGPDVVLQCSECKGNIRRRSLASGNTIGARYWSDGWCDAPMLPESLPLIKCSHCQQLVWVSELDEVASIGRGEEPPEGLTNLSSEKTPTLEEYLLFLRKADGMDKEQLLYLRRRIWWTGNHKRRQLDNTAPLTDEERNNLSALTRLLGAQDENDRLSKAEALRQLGEFDTAKSLLADEFPNGMANAARFIGKLVEQQDSQLRELSFS